ncbi:MAG: bis(5'-nucleosyl)-tetraphosphatase (symmetrical) YqeK [Candidatus Margulisbacteria bacterium]|nr:bis(5'-nucleosyl)-tetraphosphatase (symmetrical) YqeK [Candidatus Margulisiibacteriota bacterium]
MPKRNAILQILKKELDPERYAHSLRVEKTALALARRHRVPAGKASLAALLHDYARKFSRPELLKQAKRFKLGIDPVSKFEPKLLHAQLSALLAKRDFGVKSTEILRAISRHTVGAPGMNKLEKIIYLADHIEEGRNFSGVKKIRSLAAKDLDQAIIESSANILRFLLVKGLPIHPGTIRTRNYYLLNL